MPIRPLLTALLCACLLSAPTAQAAPKTFKLCWSVFAGWMPWDYAAKQGIVKKWADKYGIDIQVQEVPDYVASIERYSAGQFDACTMPIARYSADTLAQPQRPQWQRNQSKDQRWTDHCGRAAPCDQP